MLLPRLIAASTITVGATFGRMWRRIVRGDPAPITWLAEARATYERAGARAAERLGLPPPEGGTFLFFDAGAHLLPGEHDCVPFLERCLDAGVLLTPGSACGRDFSRWVRLCFTSIAPEELEVALDRLATVLRSRDSGPRPGIR